MKVACLLAMTLASCIPPTYAFVTVPIENLEGRALELAVLEIPLAELNLLLGTLRPEQLAFYTTGREAIPYRLLDADGDGVADHALIKIPLAETGGSLVVTYPGPRGAATLPTGGKHYRVKLRFDQAQH